MIIKLFGGVREGDFIRGHAYRLGPDLAQVWRKVTLVEKDAITTVNRHGREMVFASRRCMDMGLRFKVWQPGDPREDGDNL